MRTYIFITLFVLAILSTACGSGMVRGEVETRVAATIASGQTATAAVEQSVRPTLMALAPSATATSLPASTPVPSTASATSTPVPTLTPTKKVVQATATATQESQALFLRPACGDTYKIKAGKPINIQYGTWGAQGMDLAKDNASHLTVRLIIDGQLIPGTRSPIVPASAIPCGKVASGSYWVIHRARVNSLAPGKHTVEVTYTFDAQVNDGSGNYGPGTLDPRVFTIIAE